MSEIVVHAAPEHADLIAAVADALQRAMAALGVADTAEVALVFGDDADLQRLNREFGDADAPTDVLAFPARTLPGCPETPHLGDIVISVPYAARSAQAAGQPLQSELELLAVHGLLHLLGHEDDTNAGAAAMRALEGRLGVRPGR